MATIFPREEKAEMLFDKILANPEACRRLKRTFYDAIDSGDEFVTENLPAKQFTAALFDAYENKDLTAFLMAVCQNSMFDLLRNAFLIPFKFNADGQTNPIFLTDEEGKLLENLPIHVKEKEYEKFRKVYQKRDKVKMYLAHGYKKRHCYDSETMETQEYKMGEHDGVLLIYELPDTVKEKKTEAEAYAAVWDIMMELQKELPNSVVYYGQDFLQEEGKRFDEMGVCFVRQNSCKDKSKRQGKNDKYCSCKPGCRGLQRHHSKIIDCPVKIKSRYHDDNRRYSQRNSRVTDFAF